MSNSTHSHHQSTAPALSFHGATKRYDDLTALDQLDLQIDPGQVLALLGPNGAGKTTAVQLALGLQPASDGRVEIFGQPPRLFAARAQVGAMLQIAQVPDTLRVVEHVELVSSYYPRPMPIEQVIRQAALEGLERRLAGKLSGGQRQRLMFALAICGDPPLLILDEPTVGLDSEARRNLWQLINRRVEAGGSVLLTTHHLEEADALADRIAVLERGRLVASGTPQQIKSGVRARWVSCQTRVASNVATSWPEVDSATLDQGRLQLLCTAAEPVVKRLLELDPDLTDLVVHGASLEEAIGALTGSGPLTDSNSGTGTGSAAQTHPLLEEDAA